jgi:uncharacterized radical SAM superfamily Fe-S cluster-containing enzyme
MVLTVCGHCFTQDPDRPLEYERDILQGNLVQEGGRVYLRRHCQRGHGEVVSLYEEDYALWNDLQQWRAPTRAVAADAPGNALPIPLSYFQGLGELQTQHSCILLVDINQACNLSCPSCFAASSPQAGAYLSKEHVLRLLDAELAREGGDLDVLMLSGGEPTIHPHLEPMIEEALQRPVARILVNTNGIRLARDNILLAFLAERRDRVEVYLQFDGFEERTHRALRGEDLRPVKERVVERLTAAGIYTTLVMTVAQDVNEHEVGAVAELALGTRYLAGVMYQPVFGSGRSIPIDPLRRVTTTGVIGRLAKQTRMRPEDFVALPCSHPDCCAMTYFVVDGRGGYRSLPRMLGRERLRELLGLVSNTIVFSEARKRAVEALNGLLSQSITASRPELGRYAQSLRQLCSAAGMLPLMGRRARDLSTGELALRMKRISVKHFMDAWTLNVERLQQCCVHVGSPGEGFPRVPFCARQLFGGLRALTSVESLTREQLIGLDAHRTTSPLAPGYEPVHSREMQRGE